MVVEQEFVQFAKLTLLSILLRVSNISLYCDFVKLTSPDELVSAYVGPMKAAKIAKDEPRTIVRINILIMITSSMKFPKMGEPRY